jgi:hypothetical protein
MNIGEVVKFGRFHWKVLTIETQEDEQYALLFCEEIVEKMAYGHGESRIVSATWSHCSVRKFLNGLFYAFLAFGKEDQIATVFNVNPDNPWYGSWGGYETEDEVFLLSLEEVLTYFGDIKALKNRPTPTSGCINDEYDAVRAHPDGAWLLRTPGTDHTKVTIVADDGGIGVCGVWIQMRVGIRPAMWIKIKREEK